MYNKTLHNKNQEGLPYEDVDVGSPNESKDEPVYARASTPPTLPLGDCPVPSLVRTSWAEKHPYDLTSHEEKEYSTKEEEPIYEINSLDEEI